MKKIASTRLLSTALLCAALNAAAAGPSSRDDFNLSRVRPARGKPPQVQLNDAAVIDQSSIWLAVWLSALLVIYIIAELVESSKTIALLPPPSRARLPERQRLAEPPSGGLLRSRQKENLPEQPRERATEHWTQPIHVMRCPKT
jgi:hypothetical protein